MSLASAGCGSCSIFRWMSERTLFSCPAVVWMAYQRCSTGSAPEDRRNPAHEHLLENEVHQVDRHAEEQRQDDDADGQLADLTGVRPRHLPHLGDDFLIPLGEAPEGVLFRYLGGSHGYFVSL